MLPWLLTASLALLALVFFLLWRRAQAAEIEAELAASRAGQAAQSAAMTARQEVARRLALSLAHADPVLLLDDNRTLLYANPPAQALFGPPAAPGQSLILTARSVELDELIAHTLAGGEDRDRQITLHGQPYRARAVLAEDRAENVRAGVVVVLSDLSELQRLGRARRDFIANISHELRTPLTSIRLLLDTLLASQTLSASDTRRLYQKIGDEAQTLEQLAQELLDLAQIESGQALVRLTPMPVDELVNGVVERFAPQAAQKRQTIAVEAPPGLTALADAGQINRALGNLLHNAIKFTPAGGQIWIRASQMGEDVLLEVADTGPGIPPEDLPRVFERFFRGDRSRAGGGTGLGLAIARHVVEAHGGKIWVESEGRPGRGAIFRLTLLAADQPR